jgi:hypothetical protein
MAPQNVFWIASGMVVVALVIGFFFLREPQRKIETREDQESHQRSLAAQTTLHNIVMLANVVRSEKYNPSKDGRFIDKIYSAFDGDEHKE